MRLLVLVLLLTNLVFYAYAAGYMTPEKDIARNQTGPELNAHLVRIVGHGETPPTAEALLELDRIESEKRAKLEAERQDRAARLEAAKLEAEKLAAEKRDKEEAAKTKAKETEQEKLVAPPPVKIKEACFRWNGLSSSDSEVLASTLVEKIPHSRVERITVPDTSSGWWVMVPPSKTRAEAVLIAENLKTLGISDLFIINEGPKKFAISLGVFTTEKAAKEHLSKMVTKGAEMARAEPRSLKEPTYVVEVKAPTEDNIRAIVAMVLKNDVMVSCEVNDR